VPVDDHVAAGAEEVGHGAVIDDPGAGMPAALWDWPVTGPTTLPTRETRPVWPASWLGLNDGVPPPASAV